MDTAEPVIAIFMLVLGTILGTIIFRNTYRDDLCQERFIHAETAADSLVIIQDDNFCLGMIEQ